MDDTTKLIVIGALAYFAFVHNGGMLLKAIGPTAASPAPPPQMPAGPTDAQVIGSTVATGMNIIADIFKSASQSTATRGSGVSNV